MNYAMIKTQNILSSHNEEKGHQFRYPLSEYGPFIQDDYRRTNYGHAAFEELLLFLGDFNGLFHYELSLVVIALGTNPVRQNVRAAPGARTKIRNTYRVMGAPHP